MIDKDMLINKLTDRELDVVACLLNGRSIKKTALLLKISPKTVETYLRNLMLKLQCHSRDRLIDIITEEDTLGIIQKHYAQIIGKNFNVVSPNLSLKNQPINRFRILLILSMFLPFIALIYHWSSQSNLYVRDELKLPSSTFFLERPKLLEEIKNKFSTNNTIQIVLLIGEGGAGKTTVAYHYATPYIQGIVWSIHANSKETVLLSFEKLVLAIMHQEKDYRGLQLLQNAQNTPLYENFLLSHKEKLKQNPGWLLIVDNVHNFSEMQTYLPNDERVWGSGKIIITTGDFTLKNTFPEQIIYVPEMTAQEKLVLFNKIFPNKSHASIEETKAFLSKIPPFPLDVSTAAHYFKSTDISYHKYQESMHADIEQFSKAQANILQDRGNYTKTRYSIVGLSIKNLLNEHPDFGDLLLLLSLIDTQNIPYNLLTYYKNSQQIGDFFHALQKHSLLGDNKNLHKTTQEIIRKYLTQMIGVADQQQKIEVMAEYIEKYVDELLTNQDLHLLQRLLPHLLAFIKHENLMSRIAKANISVKIASIDIKRQLNQQRALKFLEESLTIYREYYPNPHPKVAKTLGEFGILKKFNYEEQKRLFEESLKQYQDYYKQESHIESAWILVHFGNLYRRLGQYEKAKEYLEKSLRIYEKQLGHQHIQTAWVLANLGRFYRHIGDQKKAKEILERCINIHNNHPIKNEIENAWVTINLGIVYHNMGDFPSSQTLIDKGIKVYEKYYNPYDYEFCWALVHKALIDATINGDWLTAEDIVSKNACVLKQKLGEDHPFVGWVLERLVRIHINLDDYQRAMLLLQKVLSIYQNKFGIDSIQVAFCKNYLGYIYSQQGNYIIANNLLQAAFNTLQDQKHPRIYLILENLVKNYKAQGKTDVVHLLALQKYEKLLIEKANEYFPCHSSYLQKITYFSFFNPSVTKGILPEGVF